MRNLNGSGNVTFTDGAIVGINIAAMVRNATTAFLDPSAGEQRKTDFGELAGTFTIRDGILTNDDMRLQAPVLRVAGSGQVDLPARTLSYRLEPSAAATLEGQGGAEQVSGVLVPVIIEGPWDDLSYKPDLSAAIGSALRDPEALKNQLEQMGGQAEGVRRALEGDPGALIEGLTGGGGGDRQPGRLGRPGQLGRRPERRKQSRGRRQEAPARPVRQLTLRRNGRLIQRPSQDRKSTELRDHQSAFG